MQGIWASCSIVVDIGGDPDQFAADSVDVLLEKVILPCVAAFRSISQPLERSDKLGNDLALRDRSEERVSGSL